MGIKVPHVVLTLIQIERSFIISDAAKKKRMHQTQFSEVIFSLERSKLKSLWGGTKMSHKIQLSSSFESKDQSLNLFSDGIVSLRASICD